MRKVIRLKRDRAKLEKCKYNNLFRIDNELAIAEGEAILNTYPERKKLRRTIIDICNGNEQIKKKKIPEVSHKDIKRLEKASLCEIPINATVILDTIIAEIIKHKESFRYRAPESNTDIVYIYMIGLTYKLLELIYTKIEGKAYKDNEDKERCEKYSKEINKTMKDLMELGLKYNYIFNELFKQ